MMDFDIYDRPKKSNASDVDKTYVCKRCAEQYNHEQAEKYDFSCVNCLISLIVAPSLSAFKNIQNYDKLDESGYTNDNEGIEEYGVDIYNDDGYPFCD